MKPNATIRFARFGLAPIAVALLGALSAPVLAEEGPPPGEIEVPAPETPPTVSDPEPEPEATPVLAEPPADEPEEDLWSFRLAAPGYVWLPDVKGTAIVEGTPIHFDLKHGDVVDLVFHNLKGYYAFYGEARRGRISARLDTYYVEFDNVDASDVNKQAIHLPDRWQAFGEIDINQHYVLALFTPSVSFTAFETDAHWGPFTGLRIEPMAGFRYTYFQADIRLKEALLDENVGKKLIQVKENWWQLLPLGVEVEVGLSENLSVLANVLLGGWDIGPDSKSSTDGVGELMLKYRMSEHFTAEAGARWFDMNIKGKEVAYQFHNMWGPMFRVMWEF